MLHPTHGIVKPVYTPAARLTSELRPVRNSHHVTLPTRTFDLHDSKCLQMRTLINPDRTILPPASEPFGSESSLTFPNLHEESLRMMWSIETYPAPRKIRVVFTWLIVGELRIVLCDQVVCGSCVFSLMNSANGVVVMLG